MRKFKRIDNLRSSYLAGRLAKMHRHWSAWPPKQAIERARGRERSALLPGLWRTVHHRCFRALERFWLSAPKRRPEGSCDGMDRCPGC